MECPHCQKEIPGKACSQCGASVPDEAKYCMHCGVKKSLENQGSGDGKDPYDIESRILCSDGACTGIIIDGKCTECGKAPGKAT